MAQTIHAVGAGKPTVGTDLARHQVMDWLLSYAIGMEYSDRADKLSKIVEHKKPQSASTEKQGGQPANRPEQPLVPVPLLVHDSRSLLINSFYLPPGLALPSKSLARLLRKSRLMLIQRNS